MMPAVGQEYLPQARTYYEPTDQGYEHTIGERLRHWRELQRRDREQRGEST